MFSRNCNLPNVIKRESPVSVMPDNEGKDKKNVSKIWLSDPAWDQRLSSQARSQQ